MVATWSGSPITWVSGNLASTTMNTEIRDRMDWIKAALALHGIVSASTVSKLVGGLTGVQCREATHAGGASGTWSSVDFGDADDWDSDGFHDTATNNERITIPAGLGGYYDIAFSCTWESVASGDFGRVHILKNAIDADSPIVPGLRAFARPGNINQLNTLHICGSALLAAGDYISASVRLDGTALTAVGNVVFSAMRRFAA